MNKLVIAIAAAGFCLSPLSAVPAAAENDRYEIEQLEAEAVMKAYNEKREARLKEREARAAAERDAWRDGRDRRGWPDWLDVDWRDRQGGRPHARQRNDAWHQQQETKRQERRLREARRHGREPWYGWRMDDDRRWQRRN